MRFCMRNTCFSNLRQGSWFQASLAGSAFGFVCGAFLSVIRLALYPPYSSVYVSLSWALPMRLAPARCIDHPREGPCGFSVPTVRLSLPVGVDSPPDYLVSENKGSRILCHCESVSYCSSLHQSRFGQATTSRRLVRIYDGSGVHLITHPGKPARVRRNV